MLGRTLIMAAVAAACLSVPAHSQQARSRGSDYGSKKICKVDGVIGSRLGAKRSCKTQAEWDELARENRTVTERIQAYTHPCMMGPNEPGSEHLVCSGGGP